MRASSSASPAMRYGGRGRLPPRFVRSTRFERATCRVSAMAFIGNRPDRATASATAVFLPARGERLFEDLALEGLATEEPLERADPLLELAHPGGADDLVVDPDRSRPPAAIRCLHLNSRLGERPCVRATNDTDMPGCSVSSTSRIFSATDHRRRRCTEVITSTRWISSDIAVRLGSCLGPHAMPPVRSKRGPLHRPGTEASLPGRP